MILDQHKVMGDIELPAITTNAELGAVVTDRVVHAESNNEIIEVVIPIGCVPEALVGPVQNQGAVVTDHVVHVESNNEIIEVVVPVGGVPEAPASPVQNKETEEPPTDEGDDYEYTDDLKDDPATGAVMTDRVEHVESNNEIIEVVVPIGGVPEALASPVQNKDAVGDKNRVGCNGNFPTIKKIPPDTIAYDSYKPCYVSIGPHHGQCSKLFREDKKQYWLSRMKAAEDNQQYRCRRMKAAAPNHCPRNGEGAQDLRRDPLFWEIRHELKRAATVYYDDYVVDERDNDTREDYLARVLLLDGYYLVGQYADVTEVRRQHRNARAQGSGSLSPPRHRGRPKTVQRMNVASLCAGRRFTRSRSREKEKQQEYDPDDGDNSVQQEYNPDDGDNSVLMVRDTWYILENQIPFFVLEKIMHRIIGCNDIIVRREFTCRALELLNIQQMCIGRDHPAASNLLEETSQSSIFHLLHLLHKLLKPRDKTTAKLESLSQIRTRDTRAQVRWHRATAYRMYTDVNFKGRDIIWDNDQSAAADVLSLLDVRMEGPNVVIPTLRVDGDTWTILLNLMALEREHPDLLGTYVSAYCLFMSEIACTKEDVELLEDQGVIDRYLGTPKSVAADFSNLHSVAIFIDRDNTTANYLKPLCRHLEKRYRSRRQNVLAWLRLNYFTWRNTSVLLGVLTALILLAAGVFSAVYQALAYYQPQIPPHGH